MPEAIMIHTQLTVPRDMEVNVKGDLKIEVNESDHLLRELQVIIQELVEWIEVLQEVKRSENLQVLSHDNFAITDACNWEYGSLRVQIQRHYSIE